MRDLRGETPVCSLKRAAVPDIHKLFGIKTVGRSEEGATLVLTGRHQHDAGRSLVQVRRWPGKNRIVEVGLMEYDAVDFTLRRFLTEKRWVAVADWYRWYGVLDETHRRAMTAVRDHDDAY